MGCGAADFPSGQLGGLSPGRAISYNSPEVRDGVPERTESPGVRNSRRWATAGLSGPRGHAHERHTWDASGRKKTPSQIWRGALRGVPRDEHLAASPLQGWDQVVGRPVLLGTPLPPSSPRSEQKPVLSGEMGFHVVSGPQGSDEYRVRSTEHEEGSQPQGPRVWVLRREQEPAGAVKEKLKAPAGNEMLLETTTWDCKMG